jgi:hypothetical protein
MSRDLKKSGFAGALLMTAFGLAGAPWLFGFQADTAATASASVIAVLLALLFVAAAVDDFDWASAGALATGAWSMVAPVVFGFHHHQAALWTHVAAGLLAMLIGIGAAELDRRRARQPRKTT